jgi:transcriptional regulator with XRE-family HTH domain
MVNIRKLKSLRVYHNLTQEQLEQTAGIAYRTYSGKERGAQKFAIEDILKLAKVLKLSLDDVNDIFFEGKLK